MFELLWFDGVWFGWHAVCFMGICLGLLLDCLDLMLASWFTYCRFMFVA